jgi:hypothetical protein
MVAAALAGLMTASVGEARTVAGRVVDAEGRPIAKARISIGTDAAAAREARPAAQSDAFGAFRIDSPAGEPRTLHAAATGFVALTFAAPLGDADETLPADVRLLADAGCELNAVDERGHGIRGVAVSARVTLAFYRLGPSTEGSNESRGETDENGRFRFACPAERRLRLVLSATEFAPVAVRSNTATTRVVLSRGREVAFRAVDERGQPLAGARAVCCSVVDEGAGLRRLATSGADGRFTLRLDEAVELSFFASGDRFAQRRTGLAVKADARGSAPPIDVVLAPLPTVAGRVVDALSRRPIAGAHIVAGGRSARSDARGEFRLATTQAVTPIAVRAAGYLDGAWSEELRRGETRAIALWPERRAPGVVVDETGRPLERVEISWWPEDRRQWQRGRTVSDAKGRFELRQLPGHGAIAVRAYLPGVGAVESKVPEGAGAPGSQAWTIVLRSGARLAGRIVGVEKRPVEGAEIIWRETPNQAQRQMRLPHRPSAADRVSSKADGAFEAVGLAPGTYTITVAAKGYGLASIPNVALEAGARHDLETVVLETAGRVVGTVVDPAGSPIAGVDVVAEASHMPWFFSADGEPAAVTDASGKFEISNRAPGASLSLAFRRSGFALKRVENVPVPVPGETAAAPLLVKLDPTARISGRVVDHDKKPIAGAAVRARLASEGMTIYGGADDDAQTDVEGRFTLTNVTPGSNDLTAEAEGHQSGRLSGLELAPGGELRGLEVTLEGESRVFGQVRWESGEAVVGASIMVVTDEPGGGSLHTGMTQADGEGRFVARGLRPGVMRLEAEDRASGNRGAVRVDVRAGDQEAVIEMKAGHRLRGRVVDSTGQPVAGVRVMPLAVGGTNNFAAVAMSTPNGDFETGPLLDGTYRLTAQGAGFLRWESPEPVRVLAADVDGLRIELDRGGTIRGRLIGLSRSEVSALGIMVRGPRGGGTGRVLADATYLAEGSPLGDVTVTAQTPGGRHATARVQVIAGVEAVADLDFGRGATLSGRVHRGDEPVTDATVDAEGIALDSSGDVATGPDGRFRIEGLAPGRHRVSVYGRGWAKEQSREIDIPEQGAEVDFDLQGAFVGGLVRAADGAPVVDAEVTLEPVEARPGASWERRSRASDSRGVFTFASVVPGAWRLRAAKNGYATRTLDLTLEEGQAQQDLEIELTRSNLVRLRVASAAGELPGRVVWVEVGPADVTLAQGGGELDARQEFEIGELAAGTHALLVYAYGFASAPVDVTVPSPSVPTVTLLPEARLNLSVPSLAGSERVVHARLIGSDGRPFRRYWGGGSVLSRFAIVSGRGSVQGIAPGRWRVLLDSDGTSVGEEVVVLEAGKTAELTIAVSAVPGG